MDEVYKASVLAARTLIEKDPDYTYATARLLFHTIAKEVLGHDVAPSEMGPAYVEYFPQFVRKGVDAELLDERLLQFDLQRLGAALKPERDLQFDYLGLQTLYDRYFLHISKTRIELPQAFFMRVAMGLSLGEIDRRGARHRVLRDPVVVRLHVQHADAVQQRNLAFAVVVVLPDHGAGRPGRHLRVDQGKRVAVQVRRRPGQRLDPCARIGVAHQGHERRIARRGALSRWSTTLAVAATRAASEGGSVHLSGELAAGHRGVP